MVPILDGQREVCTGRSCGPVRCGPAWAWGTKEQLGRPTKRPAVLFSFTLPAAPRPTYTTQIRDHHSRGFKARGAIVKERNRSWNANKAKGCHPPIKNRKWRSQSLRASTLRADLECTQARESPSGRLGSHDNVAVAVPQPVSCRSYHSCRVRRFPLATRQPAAPTASTQVQVIYGLYQRMGAHVTCVPRLGGVIPYQRLYRVPVGIGKLAKIAPDVT
ncbi:hypothetical protein J6590_052440 [Homalodisca vitripennis]|nr:hypothetical protein J6590_052440 [Homalodisca vitripennis]